MRSLIAFLVLALSACGNVASDGGTGGAGGRLEATAGTNAGGAGGQLEATGGTNAGGAGGRLEATGGTSAGGHGDGGRGDQLGGAGGGDLAGRGGGALTAPACVGRVLDSKFVCDPIPDPAHPNDTAYNLNCLAGARFDSASNTGPCVANKVTYCVPDCSLCRL